MITTRSFTFKNPEEQFRATLEEFYDYNNVQYNEGLLDKAAAHLWSKYGDDIREYISGAVMSPINYWEEERQICLAVLEEYLMDEDREDYTFEEFWNILMFNAMQANKGSLLTADVRRKIRNNPLFSPGTTLYVFGTDNVVKVVGTGKDYDTDEFVYLCSKEGESVNQLYKESQLSVMSKKDLEDPNNSSVFEYEDKKYVKVYSFTPDVDQCSLCCFHKKAGPIFVCASPFKKVDCQEEHVHWEEERDESKGSQESY